MSTGTATCEFISDGKGGERPASPRHQALRLQRRNEAAFSKPAQSRGVGDNALAVEQYYASAAFQSLAASTRKVRRGILEDICQRAGQFRYAVMESLHVA